MNLTERHQTLKERILKKVFPHRGMEAVSVHDNCGGWIVYIEYNCGCQRKCSKCGKSEEAYFGMGERLEEHLEWFPKKQVKEFYGED